MQLPEIGMKDLLDWCVPLILAWVGSGIRKYLNGMRQEMRHASDSIVTLNLQIGKLLERTEYHEKELTNHEKRILHIERLKK